MKDFDIWKLRLEQVRKFLVALAGAVALTIAVLADGQVTLAEGASLVTAYATAIGVFWAKNAR